MSDTPQFILPQKIIGIRDSTNGEMFRQGLVPGSNQAYISYNFKFDTATSGQADNPNLPSQIYLLDASGGRLSEMAASGVNPRIPVPAGNQMLATNAAPSAAVTNTVTETAFNKTYTLPANTLAVGQLLTVVASGVYSDVATPTLGLKIRIGGTAVYQFSPAALTVVAGAPWIIRYSGIVQAIGASGSISQVESFIGLQGSFGSGVLALTGITTPVTVDTTASKVVDVTAQWGTAATGNTITLNTLAIFLNSPASAI